MDFDDQLQKYEGKNVEVFLLNELVQGVLVAVRDGYFTVRENNPGYGPSENLVNLLTDRVQFIQIIN